MHSFLVVGESTIYLIYRVLCGRLIFCVGKFVVGEFACERIHWLLSLSQPIFLGYLRQTTANSANVVVSWSFSDS